MGRISRSRTPGRNDSIWCMMHDHHLIPCGDTTAPVDALVGGRLCAGACSRRELLRRVGALVVLSACSSDGGGTAPDGEAVTIDGSSITVRLDRLDALRTPGSAFVISEQRVIIIRVADRDYRAFTNVCTHSGCGISLFQAPRMICQCHGSEYDVDGINVAGPAPLPLTRYPAALDTPGTTLRISLTS